MSAHRIPLRWIRHEDCIRAMNHINSTGYPSLNRKRAKSRIGRLVLFRRYGVQPSDIHMRHTCDNRWCINPDHIIPGTIYDNIRDRVLRGRTVAVKGEKNNKAKLTAVKILEIRELCKSGVSQRTVAAQFGVVQSAIWAITSRRTWKHI